MKRTQIKMLWDDSPIHLEEAVNLFLQKGSNPYFKKDFIEVKDIKITPIKYDDINFVFYAMVIYTKEV